MAKRFSTFNKQTFKTKANKFNIFLLPTVPHQIARVRYQTYQTCVTDNKLFSLQFEVNDIIKIIRSLDTSKAHGHDDISIRILKICDSAVIKPLNHFYKLH